MQTSTNVRRVFTTVHSSVSTSKEATTVLAILQSMCSSQMAGLVKVSVDFTIDILVRWNLRIEDTSEQLHLFLVRGLSSLRGGKCIGTIERNSVGTSSCVLCREVYCTVSFVGRFIVLCPL